MIVRITTQILAIYHKMTKRKNDAKLSPTTPLATRTRTYRYERTLRVCLYDKLTGSPGATGA